jgi:hypothetical protein
MLSRLTTNQRDRVAEKVMEWGNLVFVGLVIAQLVPGTEPFQPGMVVSGLGGIALAYRFATLIMKGGGKGV